MAGVFFPRWSLEIGELFLALFFGVPADLIEKHGYFHQSVSGSSVFRTATSRMAAVFFIWAMAGHSLWGKPFQEFAGEFCTRQSIFQPPLFLKSVSKLSGSA